MKGIYPEVITRPVCSYVWRSLAKVWDLFRERIFWSIGDGQVARFFQDNWISRLGPLSQYKLLGVNISDASSVSDFITPEDGWDVDLLSTIFP